MHKTIPLLAIGAALFAAAPAAAIAPALTGASQQDRHPTATFAAPRSDHVVIQIATNPARATSGEFLSENVKVFDILADSEVQGGSWKYENQLDPGTYYALLRADPDFGTCYITGTGTYDPACANGYSAIVPFVVPVPPAKYATKQTTFRFLKRSTLKLTATPLGANTPYTLCYRTKTKKKRCLKGTLKGFSWDSAADDSLDVKWRGLAKSTKFTWYVGTKIAATKTVRTG